MPLRLSVTIQLSGTKRYGLLFELDMGVSLASEETCESPLRQRAFGFGKLWRPVLRCSWTWGFAASAADRASQLSLSLLHEIGNKMTERAYGFLSGICVLRQTPVESGKLARSINLRPLLVPVPKRERLIVLVAALSVLCALGLDSTWVTALRPR